MNVGRLPPAQRFPGQAFRCPAAEIPRLVVGGVTGATGEHYAADVIEARGGASDERLRRIEAVTDAALSGLDVDDLLDELLDRTRDLLHVDTAVVLLLDVHSRQLVATAAKGLEEEVRQGFRLNAGRGFAGRIAVDAQPHIIEDVTPANVVNPILLKRGIRSLLGVPLLV
jgi:hypothetical protein